MGLVAPWHVGSSWPRERTCVPCIGRWILNHCATRLCSGPAGLGRLCPHAFPAIPVPGGQLSGNKEPPAHPHMPLKTAFGLQLEGFRLDSQTAKPGTARARA